MPAILKYSNTHFNFLPSQSSHSSAHFLQTDHEDQPHHSFHPVYLPQPEVQTPWVIHHLHDSNFFTV